MDSENNQHYLVIDPYKGSKSSYHKLYSILREQDNADYPYTIIDTNSLPSVTKDIKNAQSIIKFSEYLETLN